MAEAWENAFLNSVQRYHERKLYERQLADQKKQLEMQNDLSAKTAQNELITKFLTTKRTMTNPKTGWQIEAYQGNMADREAEGYKLGKPTDANWSQSKPGTDEKGKPIFFQTNKEGRVRIVKGVRPPPKKGMRVYDSEGNLILDTLGGEMTPKSKGAIEEKITSGKEQYARMKQIMSGFKPEYQEIGTRLKASWTDIKSKFGQNVSPNDAKFLTEFKAFQRKAIENINLYIKEMTGAQMSEKEANRLRLAQPDPGEVWYKGDSPITFQAKANDVLKYTRAAVARFEYYRAKGFSPQKIKKMINNDEAVSLEEIASRME